MTKKMSIHFCMFNWKIDLNVKRNRQDTQWTGNIR